MKIWKKNLQFYQLLLEVLNILKIINNKQNNNFSKTGDKMLKKRLFKIYWQQKNIDLHIKRMLNQNQVLINLRNSKMQ